jgi:FkbM family methyltransferase
MAFGRSEMTDQIICFGAGTIGRFIARELKSRGTPPIRFADNDKEKWGTKIEGILVAGPHACNLLYPEAIWIATALHTPYPAEIQAEIRRMGVQSEPLTNYLSVKRPPLDESICRDIAALCADQASRDEVWDQFYFRSQGDGYIPRPPDDIRDVYFPDFIRKLDEEVFIDCGAADGDTAVEVLKRWPSTVRIVSFEPDEENYLAFQKRELSTHSVYLWWGAISDFEGRMKFTATGDQTAHLGGDGREVPVFKLDTVLSVKPTFIKMDIEGSELAGLWGARDIIRRHSPVLAICAYHEADHIWQIPLLINALNPTYKLYLRRYLEMPWEMVWYAVPPERVL